MVKYRSFKHILPEQERLTVEFCKHIEHAKSALSTNAFAPFVTLNLDQVLTKVTDENLERELMEDSSDGEISVYRLPGGNLVVPRLGSEKTKLMTDFVHIRDLKCTVEQCLKGKSKLHTLMVKGAPVCRHLLLGRWLALKCLVW